MCVCLMVGSLSQEGHMGKGRGWRSHMEVGRASPTDKVRVMEQTLQKRGPWAL